MALSTYSFKAKHAVYWLQKRIDTTLQQALFCLGWHPPSKIHDWSYAGVLRKQSDLAEAQRARGKDLLCVLDLKLSEHGTSEFIHSWLGNCAPDIMTKET